MLSHPKMAMHDFTHNEQYHLHTVNIKQDLKSTLVGQHTQFCKHFTDLFSNLNKLLSIHKVSHQLGFCVTP